MADETNGHTKDQLIEAKLELIRQQVEAGFARLEGAMASHIREDDDVHRSVEKLTERVREMELEQARESTKLKLIMAVMSVGSGGLGAALAKFVM